MNERETWSTSHLMPLEMRDHLNGETLHGDRTLAVPNVGL